MFACQATFWRLKSWTRVEKLSAGGSGFTGFTTSLLHENPTLKARVCQEPWPWPHVHVAVGKPKAVEEADCHEKGARLLLTC